MTQTELFDPTPYHHGHGSEPEREALARHERSGNRETNKAKVWEFLLKNSGDWTAAEISHWIAGGMDPVEVRRRLDDLHRENRARPVCVRACRIAKTKAKGWAAK